MDLFSAVNRGMAIATQRAGKKLGLEVVVAKEYTDCADYDDCKLCPKFVDGQCSELFVD